MLEQYLDKPKAYINQAVATVKRWTLGANNERLDFVMDSFYKLDPKQRIIVLAGAGAGIAFIILGAGFFYLSRVNALKTELNDGFSALHNLESLRASYQVEQQRFESAVELVRKKTAGVKVKPYFEKLGRDVGVQIDIINEQREPIPQENPLSARMQYVKAELRMNKVSLPRLVKTLAEIEKAGNFMMVDSLEIRSIYGTKLFFTSTVKIRGYTLGDI